MWQNFYNKFVAHRGWLVIALPAWVLGGFVLAQLIALLLIWLLNISGVNLQTVNENVLNAIVTAVIYTLTALIVIAGPWLIKRFKTTASDVGLQRLPLWSDLLLAPAGFVVYFIVSALLLAAATALVPFIDANQVQETGFNQLSQRYEMILAFTTLVIIAPFAEELLFRGYLFGKLKKHAPMWLAIVITSLLFAVVHGAWNVGIDVFALSIVLCLLRVISKSLWPSILLHMLKNGIAFYLLFINPLFLNTLGG